MKRMTRITLLLCLLLLLPLVGCASLDTVAKGVHGFCASTTPAERSAIKDRIDPKTHPHEIRIYCDAQGR